MLIESEHEKDEIVADRQSSLLGNGAASRVCSVGKTAVQKL